MMHRRFLDWARSVARQPRQAALAVAVLVLAALLAWLGVTTAWFHHEKTEAERALAGYDFPEAWRHLATCHWLRPRDPGTRLLACQAARRDGDLDAAESQLDRHDSLTRLPSPDARLERKLLLAQRGLVESVVKEMLSLVDARHPRTEEILEAMAVGSVHAYQLDKTRFWITELLQRHPRNPIGRLIRAQTMQTFGHKEMALDELRALVADYPRNLKARHHLAASLSVARLDEEAVHQYEELLRQRPGDLDAGIGLTRCLRRLERTEEARALLARLLEQAPENAGVLLESGQLALGEQRWEDAERFFRGAVQVAPFDDEAHSGLATALQQLGRESEARREEAEARRIKSDLARMDVVVGSMMKNPNDPGPRLELGQICLRNGQVEEGLRWLTGVLELSPDHPEAHNLLAEFYQSHGDAQKAAYHRNRSLGIRGFAP